MAVKHLGAICAALLILGGCGSSGTATDNQALTFGLNTLRGLFTPATAPVDLRQTLTPDVLATLDQPLLLMDFPGRGEQAGVLLAQQNGPRQIWTTQGGTTLTLVNGLLAETRGFGNDLISTDLDDVQDALAGRTTRAIRVHRYLDGENRLQPRAFVCDVSETGRETIRILAGSFPTTQITESCTGQDISFENVYWIDAGRRIQKSQQWIGPANGYVFIERAID